MAFTWWDYLDLCNEWLSAVRRLPASQVPYREARLRAIISRAYYAALMSASAHLADHRGFKMPVHASHFAVVQELERHEKAVSAYRNARDKLLGLQSARRFADYAVTFPRNIDESAEESISDAMDVRSALRRGQSKK